MTRLAAHFRLRHRYSRSVNLERDQNVPESLDGYVVTPRGRGSLHRIADSLSADNGRLLSPRIASSQFDSAMLGTWVRADPQSCTSVQF